MDSTAIGRKRTRAALQDKTTQEAQSSNMPKSSASDKRQTSRIKNLAMDPADIGRKRTRAALRDKTTQEAQSSNRLKSSASGKGTSLSELSKTLLLTGNQDEHSKKPSMPIEKGEIPIVTTDKNCGPQNSTPTPTPTPAPDPMKENKISGAKSRQKRKKRNSSRHSQVKNSQKAISKPERPATTTITPPPPPPSPRKLLHSVIKSGSKVIFWNKPLAAPDTDDELNGPSVE